MGNACRMAGMRAAGCMTGSGCMKGCWGCMTGCWLHCRDRAALRHVPLVYRDAMLASRWKPHLARCGKAMGCRPAAAARQWPCMYACCGHTCTSAHASTQHNMMIVLPLDKWTFHHWSAVWPYSLFCITLSQSSPQEHTARHLVPVATLNQCRQH